MADIGPFSSSTAFCARCGSILPLLQEFGSVKCYACKATFDAESKFLNYSNLILPMYGNGRCSETDYN